MFKKISPLLIMLLFLFAFLSSSDALTLTDPGWTEITVDDGLQGGTSPWHTSTEEDTEVEYPAATKQSYDLEGIFYDASSNDLVIVGGFNFNNIEDTDAWTDGLEDGGDIFITAGGTSYVLDIDYYANQNDTPPDNSYYTVYSGTFSTLDTDYILAASPWRRNSGGSQLNTNGISYFSTSKNNLDGISFAGDSNNNEHYALLVNLGWLGTDVFNMSYTMQCGNDLIKGTAPVPEPATMILMGTGLLGLAGVSRRKKAKKNRM